MVCIPSVCLWFTRFSFSLCIKARFCRYISTTILFYRKYYDVSFFLCISQILNQYLSFNVYIMYIRFNETIMTRSNTVHNDVNISLHTGVFILSSIIEILLCIVLYKLYPMNFFVEGNPYLHTYYVYLFIIDT